MTLELLRNQWFAHSTDLALLARITQDPLNLSADDRNKWERDFKAWKVRLEELANQLRLATLEEG